MEKVAGVADTHEGNALTCTEIAALNPLFPVADTETGASLLGEIVIVVGLTDSEKSPGGGCEELWLPEPPQPSGMKLSGRSAINMDKRSKFK